MTAVTVGSASGAPGATITAALLAGAWPTTATVVEAGPFGGTLAGACGLTWEPGLAKLAAATRDEVSAALLAEHCQQLPCGAPAVVGPPSSLEAWSSLEHLAGPLSTLMLSRDAPTLVVDCGRLWPGSPAWPLALVSEVCLVVVGQDPHSGGETAARIGHARGLVVALAGAGATPMAVVVGERPYSAAEIAGALGVVVVAVVPADVTAVNLELSGTGRPGRGAIARAFERLAGAVAPLLQPDRPWAGAESPVEVGW